jgi:hypothetical protein
VWGPVSVPASALHILITLQLVEKSEERDEGLRD